MKFITLSDHAAEQQQLERHTREQRDRDALSAWQATVDIQAQAIQDRWGELIDAARRLQVLRAIAGFFGWAAAALSSLPHAACAGACI